MKEMKSYFIKEFVKDFDFAYGNQVGELLYNMMTGGRLWYHNYQHILDIFDFAKKHDISLNRKQRLAIWFHDCIYIVGMNDNEQSSAEFALLMLQNIKLEPFDQYEIYKMILNTADHQCDNLVLSQEACIVMDLDLFNLTLSWDEFVIYGELARKEYEIDHNEWYTARSKFFLPFLQREHIFRSDFFKDKFEEQAKKNLYQLIGPSGPSQV